MTNVRNLLAIGKKKKFILKLVKSKTAAGRLLYSNDPFLFFSLFFVDTQYLDSTICWATLECHKAKIEIKILRFCVVNKPFRWFRYCYLFCLWISTTNFTLKQNKFYDFSWRKGQLTHNKENRNFIWF